MKLDQEELDQIYAEYESDPAFDELRSGATQIVRADGVVTAPDIVFVGEAPGADEDRLGVPFVGKSGYLLDELLADAKISRRGEGNAYAACISNIVKYRPPNNRDPKPDEIKASLPYLVREFQFMQPSVIVTLGRHSTKAVWPDAPSIGKCHGSVRKMSNGVIHMPMYHPAYGIYDPRNRTVLEQDFTLLSDVLKEL